MAFAKDDAAARLEGYEPIDLHQSGNVCFALKAHHVELTVDDQRSPAQVVEEVLQSPRLGNTVAEVAAETSRELKEVEAEAKALLQEIAHNMSLPAVRTLAFALRTALQRILHGVYVNTAGLQKLREVMKERAVVFLPSHRSYLDFILITFIMFNFDMKLPCIAAGQDFMNMAGITSFLRCSGAFFLRRTFGSDKLYKAVFSVYVQTLLCKGHLPMEFFIEGTRSRTAKMLHPKLGLLSMVIEPYLDGRLSDIYLVPISISYERTLEEELFARELLGVPKPKESTSALLRARSILTEDYGSIYTTIGSPVSLHEFCTSRGISRAPHTMFPKDMSVIFPRERDVILELGHVILDHIHHGMRVFPTSLVATVMLQHREGLSLEQLVSTVTWLRTEVVTRGGNVHWITNSLSAVEYALSMLSVALMVDSHKVVKVCTRPIRVRKHLGPKSLEAINRNHLSKELFESIKQEAFIPLILAHYRNQLLHLFIVEGLVALSLRRNSTTGGHYTESINKKMAQRRFEGLHCALTCEFVLPLGSPAKIFRNCVQAFVDKGLLQTTHSSQELLVTMRGEEQLLFYGEMVLPFVVGNWVVCEHLLSIGEGVETISGTIRGAQLLAAKCLNTGVIDTHESLSLGIVRNCLASLTQCGLILRPISEFSTGKDRLVKVAHPDRLTALSSTLGSVIFPLESKYSKL